MCFFLSSLAASSDLGQETMLKRAEAVKCQTYPNMAMGNQKKQEKMKQCSIHPIPSNANEGLFFDLS